jgi:uncharacterized protein YvpB
MGVSFLSTFIKIFFSVLVSMLILVVGYLVITDHKVVNEATRYVARIKTVAEESSALAEPEKLDTSVSVEDKQQDEQVPIAAETEPAVKGTTALEDEPIPEVPVAPKSPVLANGILLDVPLLNQMAAPRLFNGCEVTSLAMLLQFHGVDVSKNELASKIPRVPLKYQDGKRGNPNIGFVGNMENGPGLGVYHEPIFQLADTYAPGRVEDLTKQPFSLVMEKLAAGLPVWVIITANFAPTTEMRTWTTPQGPVDITFKMHSVVITGYDEDNLYVNDPYGVKNRKVNKESFIQAWEQMGSQAVVIH